MSDLEETNGSGGPAGLKRTGQIQEAIMFTERRTGARVLLAQHTGEGSMT